MFHLHRPVEPGDMVILTCRVDDEPTAHTITEVREGEHQLACYLYSPPCPCGGATVMEIAPVIQDIIPKEMI